MVFFNYALRKLNAKIVYYGPGLCGKTTNLVWIHDHFEGGDRGKMISLATEGDRTIFFDLLPLEIGSIRGMDVTLQLYTVPGQVHYNSTRQLVLRGADGVVFVADSQRAMQTSNIESFRNLQENLLLQGISLEGFPLALQFNKRDLKDVRTVEELDSDLNIFSVPIFEAVATKGIGVQETLEGIVKLVMRSLRERYEGAAAEARSPGAADPAATMRVPSAPRPSPVVPPRAPVPAPAVPAPPRAPVPGPVVPGSPRAAPEPPPRPAPASFEPPTVFPDTATPPFVRPRATTPVDEIVFPDAEGARTQDFSAHAGPAPGERPPGRGFEDEVSTAVYEVGDEIEIEPDDFSGPSVDGDVFTSSEERAFVDEVTKTEFEQRGAIEPPSDPAEEPDVESWGWDEPPPPEASSPVDASPDADEPMIEFAAGDVRGEPWSEPAEESDKESWGWDEPPPQEGPSPVDASPDADEPMIEFATGDVRGEPWSKPAEEPDVESWGWDEPPPPDGPPPFDEPPAADEPMIEFTAGDDRGEPLSNPAEEPDVEGWGWVEPLQPDATPPFDEPPDTDEPTIEFITGDVRGDTPPPTADIPPPSERYVDRIVASSPFAPRLPQEDSVPPASAAVDSSDIDMTFGAEEDQAALAELADDIVVDESSDHEIEVPIESPLEETETPAVEPPFTVADTEAVWAGPPAVDTGELDLASRVDDDQAKFAELASDFVVEESPEHEIEVPAEGPPEETETAAFEPPFIMADEDLFASPETPTYLAAASPRRVAVRAEDNQLHLRLHGTGAIVESGQVRELDIEVPVPGSWVGNRRVTLQLRLTLTPDTEDDNGGSGETS
jgi:GTPase SAR1 family protein